MWKIKKPLLQDALSDIDNFLKGNLIDTNDVKPFKALVRHYDSQNGMVNTQQLQTVRAEVSEEMLKNYGRLYRGKKYYYIRKTLMKGVSSCPYCGIGETSTLDHYMPKEDYKALASCRLNLIPECATCNNLKLAKKYSNFIHPYYVNLPRGHVFLKANVKVVSSSLVFKFYIDPDVITDVILLQQISTQWKELRLNYRFTKSTVSFIKENFIKSLESSDILLSVLLNDLSIKEDEYGLNDWRCAVMRILIEELKGINKDEIFAALNHDVNSDRNDNV